MVNSAAGDFLKERYYQEGEDWEKMCCRVANFHADNPDEFKEYFDMLSECKALPNSPTLMNSGTKTGYLSACNLIPVPDDLEGIMDAVKATAMIQKGGGGTGLNFSDLRPTGDTIGGTGGVSSGPVSFLKLFNACGQVIKQGGKRRSAQLGLLRYDHPDVLRWIHAKDENGDLTGFNLSVGFDDEFFEKVERGEDVVFINPRTKEPFTAYDPSSGSHIDAISARKMLNIIAESMWKSGEPGIIFWDTLQRGNPTPNIGPLHGVNPCVTGDTLIAVADGRNYVSIEQLTEEGKDVPVYTFDGTRMRISTGRNPHMTRKSQPIYKITFDNNSSMKATADHRIMKRDGMYVRVSDLEVGESIMPFNRWAYIPKGKKGKYWAIGTNERKRRWLPEHRMITEYHGHEDAIVPHHVNYNGQDNSITNLMFLSKEQHDSIHDISGDKNPMCFWWGGASEEEKQAYRKKMSIATSGERNGRYGKPVSEETRVKKSRSMKKYYAEHPEKKKEISISLSEWFKEHGTEHLKGERSKRVIFVCPVCGSETRMTEAKSKLRKSCSLGCANTLRTMELTVPEIYNHRIISIEHAGNEDVYNLTVDDYHNYAVVTNPNALTRSKRFEKHSGIVIANCGESPLRHWESCCLGSINLYEHIKDGEIDYDNLAATTKTMTRMLNSVIDKNVYPLPHMQYVAELTRKIGIGVMGFADVLGVLGVRYGSNTSIKIIENIMGVISCAAGEESDRLAKEYNPYPAWVTDNGPKRRNSTLVSMAPTGSISFIAGVSSGIEPFFKIGYKMNRENKDPLIVIAKSFIDDIDAHDVNKEKVLTSLLSRDLTPTQLIKEGLLTKDFSHYVTSGEVSPKEHVKVQAMFQKYTDLAVSKTINMPNQSTINDVKQIIQLAHKSNCKGMTVFRDGCLRDAFLTEIKCSSCGSTNLEHKEGCITCADCGVSLCSVS